MRLICKHASRTVEFRLQSNLGEKLRVRMNEADHDGDLSEFSTQIAKRIEKTIDQALRGDLLNTYQRMSLTWASQAPVGLSLTETLERHFRYLPPNEE